LYSWLHTRVPTVLTPSQIPAEDLLRPVQKLRTHKASHKSHTHIFRGLSSVQLQNFLIISSSLFSDTVSTYMSLVGSKDN